MSCVYLFELLYFSGSRAKTIGGIDIDSVRSIRLLDHPWYYAEAYHLLMLSQLKMMNGKTSERNI